MASAAPLPSLRPVPPAPVVARADRAADDGDPAPTLRDVVRSDDWHR